MKLNKITTSAVVRSKNYRFMTATDIVAVGRRIESRIMVTSMTPLDVLIRMANRWKPKIIYSRHFVTYGAVKVKLTGLTVSEQYGLLWSRLGDWKLASKIQNRFNAQFRQEKRTAVWFQAGKVVT